MRQRRPGTITGRVVKWSPPGAYTGARIQSRLPDAQIRCMIGILVISIGARYLWSGLG